MSNDMTLKSNCKTTENPLKTVGEYVWSELQALNNQYICLIDANTDQHLTVSQLKSLSNSIAVALIKRRITKTDRFVFYGQNSIQHTVLRFAAFFTGNTYISVTTAFSKHDVGVYVKTSGPNVIFTSAQDLQKFDDILSDSNYGIRLVVIFDGKHDKYITFEQLVEEGSDMTLDRIPYFDVNPEKDMFCLIYTSGSTGSPKCVMISHRVFMNKSVDTGYLTSSMQDHFGNIVIGAMGSLGNVSGTFRIPLYILKGLTVVLFSDNSEELVLKSIEKYKIIVLQTYPQMFYNYITGCLAKCCDLSSLRAIITGALPLPTPYVKVFVDRYGLKIINRLALTEYVLITRGCDLNEEYIPGCVGQVSTGTELKITDLISGESLGPNIVGEICIRGNKMFSGYLNNEKESKDAFDRNGWFRTGDVGHYDEKERMFITGRLKYSFKVMSNGVSTVVNPEVIEDFLLTNKSVADVAVVGIKCKDGFYLSRAYIQIREGHSISAKDIHKYVSDNLPPVKHLKAGIVFVEHINRITGMGKVNRTLYKNLVNNEIIEC